MKNKTQVTSATVLRNWLNDNYLIEDQARLAKATLKELFKSVRYYDGDPTEILNSYHRDGSFPKEDTSVKHFKVTATIEVEVTAVDEDGAKQEAYDQFESMDMACDLPWKAEVIDPPAGSQAEIDRRNIADYDKWNAKRSDEDVRRDADLYAETVAFLEKNANNLPS